MSSVVRQIREHNEQNFSTPLDEGSKLLSRNDERQECPINFHSLRHNHCSFNLKINSKIHHFRRTLNDALHKILPAFPAKQVNSDLDIISDVFSDLNIEVSFSYMFVTIYLSKDPDLCVDKSIVVSVGRGDCQNSGGSETGSDRIPQKSTSLSKGSQRENCELKNTFNAKLR